jgi:hypothetical protein
MDHDEDFLHSSWEWETRIERRVQERLAAAGVPPEEAEQRALAETTTAKEEGTGKFALSLPFETCPPAGGWRYNGWNSC